MNRCEQVIAAQAQAIQIIWAWQHAMIKKIDAGGVVTKEDIDRIEPPTESIAVSLRRCG